MTFLGDLLQNTANGLHSIGIQTPELGLTETAGGVDPNQKVTYRTNDGQNITVLPKASNATTQYVGSGNNLYDANGTYIGANILNTSQNPYFNPANFASGESAPQQTGMSQQEYDQLVASNNAKQAASNTANEKSAYQDQIDNLDRLLGFTQTKKQQALQGVEDQYNSTKTQQDKAFNDQRLQNTQNQEKGYNEVGNFANTSLNNLSRLLQGNNAGRSSVGQVLMPFMVGRSADTRRKAVTDTAGENSRNIDTTANSAYNDLSNQRLNNLSSAESSFGNTEQDLTSQKRQAQIARDMANGQSYAQAKAGADSLTNDMSNRYAQLSSLFDKYKPNYTVKDAPALSTYQIDPAQIQQSANGQADNSFYLNQLRKKKELNQVG